MRDVLRSGWLLAVPAVLLIVAVVLWVAEPVGEMPASPTTTTSVWGPVDVVVEVGGDSYRCREMRWRDGDLAAELDLRNCELEAPDA